MLFGQDPPVVVPVAELNQWEEDELQLEHQLLALMAEVMPEEDYPVADETSFTINWRSEECSPLPPLQFALMKCLLAARGRYVPYRNIASALEDPEMGNEAIRKNKERLVKALKRGQCRALAACIVADEQKMKFDISKIETVHSH